MVLKNSWVNAVLEHDDVGVVDDSVSWNARVMKGSDGKRAVIAVHCAIWRRRERRGERDCREGDESEGPDSGEGHGRREERLSDSDAARDLC